MCLNSVRAYFYTQDFEWNPFNNDFEYSQISFKSSILSSFFNLL